MWAFATLNVYHSDLMASIAERVLQEGVLAVFRSQDVANTVWAFARLGVHDPKLMAATAVRMLQVHVFVYLPPPPPPKCDQCGGPLECCVRCKHCC